MQRKYFGTTSDGIPVHIFVLESASGVAVRVMEYGASLVSIETPDKLGRSGPIVLGFETLSGYLESGTSRRAAHGAILGRYAGRIGDAGFRLAGKLDTISPDGGHRERGDGAALHRAVWWGEALSEGVRFHYRSPAGAEGYPGSLDCSVEYRLDAAGELRLDYRATSDARTVVDLTSQIYFNLKDAGRSPILDHELTIDADEVVETDRDGIPTGHLLRIGGSQLDFSATRRLGRQAEFLEQANSGGGLCYVLRKRPQDLRVIAQLSDPVSGRGLELLTTQPGVFFESGSGLTPNRGGQLYGLCLRPQNLPDAPNHRHFPSPALAPGSVYRQTTVFRFENDR